MKDTRGLSLLAETGQGCFEKEPGLTHQAETHLTSLKVSESAVGSGKGTEAPKEQKGKARRREGTRTRTQAWVLPASNNPRK